MRAKVLGLLFAAVLVIGAVAVVPAMADEAATPEAVSPEVESPTEPEGTASPLVEYPCSANYFCAYPTTNYSSPPKYVACSSFGEGLGGTYRSAKNRCGGKWSRLSNGVCMNAGGDRPSPGDFNAVTLPDYNNPNC